MALRLAERYRDIGDYGEAAKFISMAVENHPGHEGLRGLEESFKENQEMIISWKSVLLPEQEG